MSAERPMRESQDTIAAITCPLSSAPDGGCLSCELVASRDDGANTRGLEVVSGVVETRSPRSSGSRGTVELGWW